MQTPEEAQKFWGDALAMALAGKYPWKAPEREIFYVNVGTTGSV